jgi:predicted nuclease of predicted toxin-antitoxin system
VKLALDHHYSPTIAERLRERELDVIAAAEVGWEAEDDETLLALCATQQRVLLTNNVADFAVIARRWQAEGRPHHGLVFTSDHSLPRTRDTIGRYVDALANLMHASPGDEGFADRIHWL